MAKTPQSIRPPLQADPSGGTPCRVPPCPGTPDPTHTQKGDHDDKVTPRTPTLAPSLPLPLPLILALTLILALALTLTLTLTLTPTLNAGTGP